MYGQREIAYCQNDKVKRKKIFIELVLFRFIAIFIASIIYYYSFKKYILILQVKENLLIFFHRH